MSIDKSAGGTATYLQLLSLGMRDLTKLTIVTSKSDSPIEIDANIHFLNLSLKYWFGLKKEFSRILQKEQPDIVHINGIWTPQNYLFQKEAQKLEIKVIVSPHGMLEPYILNRHPLKKKIALFLYQKKALKNSNYFHSTATRELNQIRGFNLMQPTSIIPNGIDSSEITIKTKWEEKPKKTILFLSRIHQKKGIELLIDAVSQLKQKKIKVIIAGEGDFNYIKSLKTLAQKKNVDHLVHFIGGIYNNKKWELYHQSDIFVLPTHSENFGIVVTEALASGIPVITTTGTPWEELNSHDCGWCIDLTTDNLIRVLEDALSKDFDALKEMGKKGRTLVEEMYDIQSVGKRMHEFYNWIFDSNKEKPTFIN